MWSLPRQKVCPLGVLYGHGLFATRMLLIIAGVRRLIQRVLNRPRADRVIVSLDGLGLLGSRPRSTAITR